MEEFDRVWNVNVRGVYYLSQLVAQKMAERKQGTIIHVDGHKLDIVFENGTHKRVMDSFVTKA